jgi:hypothetical protein
LERKDGERPEREAAATTIVIFVSSGVYVHTGVGMVLRG